MKTNTQTTLIHGLIFLPVAVFFITFFTTSAQAQFLWSERIASTTSWPGDVPDVGLALDTNDNCYVTGWFDDTNNFGGVTLTNQSGDGGSDIFVAKYNSSGALQWAQRAGGTVGNQNTGTGIGLDTNGNVYVTGGVFGSATFGSSNLPASQEEGVFLAKYNNAGTLQWIQHSYGVYDLLYGTGLAVDGSGNSYVLAFDDSDDGSTLTFGSVNVTIPINDGECMFLIKYTNTGAVQWAQLLGSLGEVWATKVAVDATGNVYVRGGFTENITIGTSNLMASPSSEENMFIAKFNNAGGLVWFLQATGGNVDEGGVAVDQAENVYASGEFDTNINFGGISLTNTATNAIFGDAFVAKYNSSGGIQWAEQAGGTNGGYFWDMVLDKQTNAYPAGFLGYDAAVVKYNPAGTLEWTYSASSPPANPVSSIVNKCAVDLAGHCYLAGWYQGTNTFGTNTLQPQETLNFFLTEVAVTSPQMALTLSGNRLIVKWPTNAADFTLQTTTNLTPQVTWSNVSITPVIINGQNVVTNPITGTQKFYRLSQ